MLQSDNADRTKSQSRPRLHRTLLASAAVLSVAIMLGGVFAYRELSPLDSFLQVHAAPNSAVSVQSLRIPATTVRAAQSVAQSVGFADVIAAVVSVRVKIDEPAAMRMTENSGLPFPVD